MRVVRCSPLPSCQAPGVIGSVLGLVGPVSVYCDWVRWKVWFATCISVWQRVKLSRSVPEIHSHVAGTLGNQQTTTTTSLPPRPLRDSEMVTVINTAQSNREQEVGCLLVGCLTSQQHACVTQGRICSDKFTCYYTESQCTGT